MPGHPEPLEDEEADGRRSAARRRTALVAVGLLCLLAVAGALIATRPDGGSEAASSVVPPVTFGPEGDATTIHEPPPNFDPVMELSLDSGPAGTEVTLQGAGFKAGKGFGRIDLFWDKAGGQRLDTVDGPRFSVKLTIPPDAPVTKDAHNVVAVQRRTDGKLLSQTSVPFFVVPGRR